MNDQDYIRKAMELAGWQTTRLGDQSVLVFIPTAKAGTLLEIGFIDDQHVLDSLRCHLERQVDALNEAENYPRFILLPLRTGTTLQDTGGQQPMIVEHKGDGRTMNTIKVVVDSKVLVETG